MTLAGCDSAAVAEYIGATTDIVPHDQLVASVWRATSGNPLFVGEAVRLLSAEGSSPRSRIYLRCASRFRPVCGL